MAFNRTLEELKCLIGEFVCSFFCAFNRTLEELKFLYRHHFSQTPFLPFNRTLEELKWGIIVRCDKVHRPFNRTLEELKLG